MREILFRGKRIEDGEWVYGLPYAKSRYSIIRSTEMFDMNDEEVHMHSLHVVIPETVGQYTGLKDKNGKKIFEGDVVDVTYSDGEGDTHYMEIEMKNPFDYTIEEAMSLNYSNQLEIITNIHEEVQE